MEKRAVKLFIWSNSERECERLKSLVSRLTKVEVVGEATSDSITLNELTSPDVILYITEDASGSDLDELQQLQEIGTRILVVSRAVDEKTIAEAIKSE